MQVLIVFYFQFRTGQWRSQQELCKAAVLPLQMFIFFKRHYDTAFFPAGLRFGRLECLHSLTISLNFVFCIMKLPGFVHWFPPLR